MITVQIQGDKELQAKFKNMPASVNLSLMKAMTVLTIKLKDNIINNKLSGQVLNKISGNLIRSIQQTVTGNSYQVKGSVFSAGDVKYAAIHEYGGTIQHPGGTAYIIDSKTKMAVFISNAAAEGKNYPRTAAHEITMPERSYMRTAFAEFQDTIKSTLTLAIQEGTK